MYAGISTKPFKRARNLCSDEEDTRLTQREILNKLSEDGYLKTFVKPQFQQVIHPIPRDQRQWATTATTPYKRGTSGAIRSVLYSISIRMAFKRGNSLHTKLVHLKESRPRGTVSNLVYSLGCKNCSKIYVGETARELHFRIAEHRIRVNKRPGNEYEYGRLLHDSTIAGHTLDTGDEIDFVIVRKIRREFNSVQERKYADAI